jgi:uncharacterized repeat protein (TIGR02543 family)
MRIDEKSGGFNLNYVNIIEESAPTQYTLTTSATNGDITLDPSGGTYDADTDVEATADPDEGYSFVDWEGAATGSTNPVIITMDADKSLTANFTAILVSSITIPEGDQSKEVGDADFTLTADVSPSNALNQSVNWASTDENVATVTSGGVVSIVAAGSADISATSTDGSNVSDVVTVTVTDPLPIVGEPIPWLEDFTGLADGTTSDVSPTGWSLTGTTSFRFEVISEQLHAQNLDNEVVFSSNTIDISTASSVDLSIEVQEEGRFEPLEDYIRLYYKVDGGSEVFVDEVNDDLDGATATLSATEISGSTLEIVIRMFNNGGSENWIVDNISVSDPKSAEATLNNIAEASLKLYPNPSSVGQALNIELKGFENETDATISIMDISGRIAYSTNVKTHGHASHKVGISTDNLSAGMYMVIVRGSNKVINQRLIVR